MISDGRGRPLVLGLTGGNVNDTLMFGQLKQWSGLARRYDKHARNYLGGLQLSGTGPAPLSIRHSLAVLGHKVHDSGLTGGSPPSALWRRRVL